TAGSPTYSRCHSCRIGLAGHPGTVPRTTIGKSHYNRPPGCLPTEDARRLAAPYSAERSEAGLLRLLLIGSITLWFGRTRQLCSSQRVPRHPGPLPANSGPASIKYRLGGHLRDWLWRNAGRHTRPRILGSARHPTYHTYPGTHR